MRTAWSLFRHSDTSVSSACPLSRFLLFVKGWLASLWLVSPVGLSGCLEAAAIPGLQSVAGLRGPNAHGWVEASRGGDLLRSVLPKSHAIGSSRGICQGAVLVFGFYAGPSALTLSRRHSVLCFFCCKWRCQMLKSEPKE